MPQPAGEPAVDPGAIIDSVKRQLPRGEVESLARQDVTLVLSYVFQGMPQDRIDPLEKSLRSTAVPAATFSIFFARPGAQ